MEPEILPQPNPQDRAPNPSLGDSVRKRYNPKREANTQTRRDQTGLEEFEFDEYPFDEDPLEETDRGFGRDSNSSSASGSVRNDDSGAI